MRRADGFNADVIIRAIKMPFIFSRRFFLLFALGLRRLILAQPELELTRVIELYNYRLGNVRTGQYHAQTSPPTEDGFAPGP